MSSLWNANAGESGILRKSDYRDRLEDLLVFGYACKLFRDDEKAKEIDKGKHLIPWMGENSLKIDRYDCRGALSDLLLYEASKEGYDANRWLGLSDSERHLEQLCDEERYRALHGNEEEEELYKEEEKKRLQSHGQVEYNYDVPQEPEGTTLLQEEDDVPFTAPTELDIPVNMTLPTTVKQNARIEKTALFISKEGPQMEILLKTKQANNSQFAFMNQDDALYRYYRHVLMAIKTGRYKVHTEISRSEEEERKQDEDHYLHPSLAAVSGTNTESMTPPLPPVTYKPSANCAYSQLVNRIQGTQPIQEVVNPTPEASNGVQQNYNHPAYLQHYQLYGYYPNYDANNPYYAQYNQATYEQYQQYFNNAKSNASNPYAQIVSNVKSKEIGENKVINDSEESSVQNDVNTDAILTKAPVLYNQIENSPPISEKNKKKVKKIPLFSLAQYSSSSESDNDSDETDGQTDAQAVVVPPADMQLIIDKMASYVAKNGADFETIVKSKGDQRFIFLDPNHLFFPYYKYKLKEFGGGGAKVESKTNVEEEEDEEDNIDSDGATKKENIPEMEDLKSDEKTEKKPKIKDKKIITPVCFSIKKPKDVDSVNRDKNALPVEDSTDEEEQNKEEKESSNVTSCEENSVEIPVETSVETTEVNVSQVIEIEDPIMELIDLTDEMEDKRDAKRAEDRLKDKLAAAARDKLATKNKALQMERKKRAAAFLSQLKPSSTPKSDSEEIRNVRASTPEEGEINGDTPSLDDLSRLVYHIEPSSPKVLEKNHRSRSPKHKSSHHRRKSHKRSRSRTRKRKREKRSHERKKPKRKYHSRSRSKSRHGKNENDVKTIKSLSISGSDGDCAK